MGIVEYHATLLKKGQYIQEKIAIKIYKANSNGTPKYQV